MGDMADDLINGFYCESCGEMIDGHSPGYARKCNGCTPSPARKYEAPPGKDLIEAAIKESGFTIASDKQINYGHQFRLTTGTIVNLYCSGKFTLQGKPSEELKKALKKVRIYG